MADKTVKDNVKNILKNYTDRFAANPQAKKVMNVNSSGNKLKDIASGNRVKNLNTLINGRKANPKKGREVIEGLKQSNKNGALNDFIADVRKTRNNELAKTIAVDSIPVIGATGIAAAAHKIHKKRKDEKNMEKMSAQQYEEFIEKLADEILEEEYDTEEGVVEEDYEDYEDSNEDFDEEYDEEDIAKRAYAAYEAAQMQKEAAESDFNMASAYEEAALVAMEELGLLDD